jgi:hypothetical protein
MDPGPGRGNRSSFYEPDTRARVSTGNPRWRVGLVSNLGHAILNRPDAPARVSPEFARRRVGLVSDLGHATRL